MDKLEIGKKYKTKNDIGNINLEFEVIDIKENRVLIKILKSKTNYLKEGIKSFNYDINSQLVKNSKEIVMK